MDKEARRAHHDLGGVEKFMCEPVDIRPHGLSEFDREVDALRQMLAAKQLMSVDELRRGIEAIPGDRQGGGDIVGPAVAVEIGGDASFVDGGPIGLFPVVEFAVHGRRGGAEGITPPPPRRRRSMAAIVA